MTDHNTLLQAAMMSQVTMMMNQARSDTDVMLMAKSILLMCLLQAFVTNFTQLTNWFSVLFTYYKNHFVQLYLKWVHRNKFTKTATVSYITENVRDINLLYKSLHWYLATRCRQAYFYLPEVNLSFCEERNSTNLEKPIEVTESPVDGSSYNIEFKNHKLEIISSTPLTKLYTDKERNKENPTFTIRAEINIKLYKKQIGLDKPKEEFSIVDSKSFINFSEDTSKYPNILNEFVVMCHNEWLKETNGLNIPLIYTNTREGWEHKENKLHRTLDGVVLREGQLAEIKNIIDDFKSSEERRKKLNISYKLGLLLYGPPGTGKTTLIQSIANYMGYHIATLNGSIVKTDEELFKLFKSVNYRKTILVIEDIDVMMPSVTKSRNIKKAEEKEISDNKSENRADLTQALMANLIQQNRPRRFGGEDEETKNEVTLSGLLNALDGLAVEAEGRILFMTCNHPDLLDPAIIRAHRIDHQIRLDKCNINQIVDFYRRFFNQDPDMELINRIETLKYSPAEVSAHFVKYPNKPKEALLEFHKIGSVNLVREANFNKYVDSVRNILKELLKKNYVEDNSINKIVSVGLEYLD